MTTRGDLGDRLASWLDRLTENDLQRIDAEVADIERRWPGPGYEPERQAALAATARWLAGEITTSMAGSALIQAHERAALALAAARQVARLAVLDGMPVEQAAAETGVEPATLQRDLVS